MSGKQGSITDRLPLATDQQALITQVRTDPAAQVATTYRIRMKPNSIQSPTRTGITHTTDSSSIHPPAAEKLIALIQQATAENRWNDAVVLLNQHPKLFQNHPELTLTLTAGERHLEDMLLELHPDVHIPAVRLENMNLQRSHSLKLLVGRLGVTDLQLHGCDLADQAWQGLSDGIRLSQFQGLPGLSAFSFCASMNNGQTPADITQGLTDFLDSVTHLKELTLGWICLDAAPLFAAMKGKVDNLKLRDLLPSHFVVPSGAQPISPDVKGLSLDFAEHPVDDSRPAEAPSKALRALITENSPLSILELTSAKANVDTFRLTGKLVSQRRTPITVRLPGELNARTEQGCWSFLSGVRFNLDKNAPPVKSLHISAFRDEEAYLLTGTQGLEELHIGSDALFHLHPNAMEYLLDSPSIRVLEVSGAHSGRRSQLPTDQPARDARWAPVLNAFFKARASAHFLETYSLSNATASLPPELTPALLDLPARPRASAKTPHLHSVKLVNKESYNTWVDSVKKARAELPPSSSRFVPKLTRLPTDNG